MFCEDEPRKNVVKVAIDEIPMFTMLNLLSIQD